MLHLILSKFQQNQHQHKRESLCLKMLHSVEYQMEVKCELQLLAARGLQACVHLATSLLALYEVEGFFASPPRARAKSSTVVRCRSIRRNPSVKR